MLSHFQWKPLFENKQLPGWRFSFFFKGTAYFGIYHKDGHIEWTSQVPPTESEQQLNTQIHELMLFHVYE
ncbi:YheE family protein [Cytobacillus sp. S13-E01]|uniref:YheE family protein n=1 Tax=Cytobacillus sp. S13-E01 TaxID=3031326 RepID=UPI0023D82739|nr:YheE family protein [Cytobacillus sp. S13-E01]MDF0726881.1 YheE family protein [Cytobacillus sp. S13-E01]